MKASLKNVVPLYLIIHDYYVLCIFPFSSFEQYSALIDGIFNVLLFDLKRDIAKMKSNQKYKSSYGLKTQQHPVIAIIDKDPVRLSYLIDKIVGVCDHPDEKYAELL